ncbi:MAG: T9SS type A sorting domain-containing protein [Bacteroidales bacterium]|nr:T9SS type A sorting domain-containing protein [Bacteroidales bacterium]
MRLKSTYLALMAAFTLTASAAPASLLDSNRTLYGYFNNSSSWDGDHGFASVDLFNPQGDPIYDVADLLYSFNDHGMASTGMFAGAGYEGVLYCFSYVFGGAAIPTGMISYDINTGLYSYIAPYDIQPQDATFDRKTGTMYALSGNRIWSVNLETAEFTPVVTIKSDMGFVTLAADAAGELYSIALDGVLYKVDKTSGVISKIIETGAEGFFFQQSMEFDPTTGNLIWAANASTINPFEMELIEFNLSGSEPTMTNHGVFGSDAVFNSLYIEGAASYAAPGVITEIAGTYDAATKSVTLTWTNPTTTFGGEELTELNGADILCDGKRLATLSDCKPGEKNTYTTTDVTMNAENRFSVVLFGNGGDGMPAYVPVYVGQDMPASPSGLTIKGTDDYATATLSWEPVTTGYHKGDLDAASVKYKIIRRPTNNVVADGLTETTFTDNKINRTLAYYYDVIAYNEIGEAPAAVTGTRILGPAFECPFEENFDDNGAVQNKWLMIDGNNDMSTWMLSSSAATTFFGDAETGLEYMLSPTGMTGDDADEWFISGPIKFEAGKNYEMILTARSLFDEQLEILFGQTEVPAELTKVKDLTIEESEYFEGDISIRPSYYSVALPTEGKEMVASVGLHLITPNTQNYCFLQISDIQVIEQGTGAVSTVAAPAVASRYHNGNFEVIGNFEKVEIYNVAGVKVAESTEAVISMSNYEAGVYVATITTANGRSAVKFVK